jgi:hypothetical protein
MIKTMIFLRARAGRDRSEFQQWCLRDYGQSRLRHDPMVRRLLVNLVDVVPGHMPWQRPGEVSPIPEQPPFDAVLEAWMESADGAESIATKVTEDLAAAVDRREIYQVTEWIEKDGQPTAIGDRSPGVKYVALCAFHDDLTEIGAKRSWAQHVGLALEVHVGVSKYVRNWVDLAIATEETDVRGIVELHFKTMRDLETRWFDSDHGRARIIQDVGHFLKGAVRMFTSEYMLS